MVDETSNEDILLHANVLQKFGRNSIAEGSFIDFKAQKTSRGLQVAEILSIDPSSLPRPELKDLENLELSYIQTLPLEPARVKWFDSAKGFGFVNIYGKDTDVFIHIEILRRSGLTDFQVGETVALRVIDGRRGKWWQNYALGTVPYSKSYLYFCFCGFFDISRVQFASITEFEV